MHCFSLNYGYFTGKCLLKLAKRKKATNKPAVSIYDDDDDDALLTIKDDQFEAENSDFSDESEQSD